MYEQMIDTLADLHVIDPDSAALGDFGKPGNYFERQVARYSGNTATARPTIFPRSSGSSPSSPKASPRSPARRLFTATTASTMSCSTGTEPLTAVLDWELATLGDPVADFSYLAMQWMMPADGGAGLGGLDLQGLGIPSLDEIVERYSDRSGVPVSGKLDWYFAYNLFRLTGIVQGIKKRAGRDGVTCAGGGDGSSRSHAGAGGVELRGEGGRLARRDGDRHAFRGASWLIVYSFARSISGSGSLPSLRLQATSMRMSVARRGSPPKSSATVRWPVRDLSPICSARTCRSLAAPADS